MGRAVTNNPPRSAMIDPVIASRVQFALTTIVHIIFPVMSMGLAPFLIHFTWKDIQTNEPVYEQLRRFWTKIFAISFVAGTVTGIVLEFEFGTNFAAFATAAGELFGGPLAIEGIMEFMLEATFLGVFVFGRKKVGDKLYLYVFNPRTQQRAQPEFVRSSRCLEQLA
jgi:cytochrome d ubiquinol oxidase subunit I